MFRLHSPQHIRQVVQTYSYACVEELEQVQGLVFLSWFLISNNQLEDVCNARMLHTT